MSAPRIVIVNDDPVQLRQLAGVLDGAGYEVSSFLDAAEALAGVDSRAGVDLFIVDLHMPGIDGWKLCRLLRSPGFERFNRVPIMVVSATFTGDDVASITHEIGANAFLEVPFDGTRLISYVERLLAGERPRSEPSMLIVDDDEGIRLTLRRAYEQFGYVVAEAGTAAEARAVWADRPTDVVLLDYHLPDETCESLITELQTPEHRTSILVMTGDDDPSLPVRLLARGADAYLRKPFDVNYVAAVVGKARRQRALLRIETVLDARTRELGESERRYRGLFETIPDLVFVVDRHGHVVEVNPDALRALRTESDQVVDRSLMEFVRPDDVRPLSEWLRAVTRGTPSTLETRLLRTDGSVFPIELRGRAVEAYGAPAALLVGRDLTERVKAEEERKRLEAQMQRAQRLESLGVLAGGVAHDFNNLLVGILGNASLALMDIPADAPERESIEQIEVSARRAAELTQQILVFAGRSRGVSTDVSLSELMHELGKLVEPAVSKKARVSYELTPDLPSVEGDPGQLRQVAMNLIINASDALEGRPGNIHVRTRLRELRVDHRMDFMGGKRAPPGRYVELEVTDEGCGMEPETLNRIFEPFFTTKASGRGLGLASTLGIVHAHDGYISVRSKPGVGSTFTVLLPPDPVGDFEEDDDASDPPTSWGEGGRILVVDDESAVRRLACAVLARHGFTTREARDGTEGVAYAVDTSDTVDAVLMDVTMPEMDGMEALAQLRLARPRLPVLLSSGYPPDEGDAGLGGDPFTGFIAKPYAPGELVEAMHALLSSVRGVVESSASSVAGD